MSHPFPAVIPATSATANIAAYRVTLAPVTERLADLADLGLPACALNRMRAMAMERVAPVPAADTRHFDLNTAAAVDFLDGCIAVCELAQRRAIRLGAGQ